MHTLVQQRNELALEEIKTMFTKISNSIGTTGTDEHGAPIGTGIRGDMMRIGAKVDTLYDIKAGWERYFYGALFSGGIFITAIWFVVKEKLKKVFT